MELISLLPINNNQQSNTELRTNQTVAKGEFAHLLGNVLSTGEEGSPNHTLATNEKTINQEELIALMEATEWEDLPEEWQQFMYIDLRDESLFIQQAANLLNIAEEQVVDIFDVIQSFLTHSDEATANGERIDINRMPFAALFSLSDGRQAQVTPRGNEINNVLQLVKLVQMMNQQTQPAPLNQAQLDMIVKEVIMMRTNNDLSSQLASVKLGDAEIHKHPLVNIPISIPLVKRERSQLGTEIDVQAAMKKAAEEHAVDVKSVSATLNITGQTKSDTIQILMQQNGKPVAPEQLIRQFEHILSRAKFTVANGIQKLSIQLTPEHLGTLKIEIMQKDQMMIARIIASTHAAKEAFESSAQSLRQAFLTQNIAVDKIEIYQTSLDQKQADESLNQREKKQSNQEDERPPHKTEQDAESISFFDELEAELLNLKV